MTPWTPGAVGGRITAAERRAQVIALRRRRATFGDIGRVLGISRQRAHQIYLDALKAIPAPDLEAHRTEELELVDDACRGLLAIAMDRNVAPRDRVAAYDVLRGWAERKARLLGLDAAAKVRVEIIDDQVIRALAEEAERDIERFELEAARHRPALPPGGQAPSVPEPAAERSAGA